jgi:hypothetical protein
MFSRRSTIGTFVAAAAAVLGGPRTVISSSPSPRPVVRDEEQVVWSIEKRGNNVIVTHADRTVTVPMEELLACPDKASTLAVIRRHFATCV